MEVLLGMTGKDFCLTATDNSVVRSIVIMKSGEDKSRQLNPNTLLTFSGEAGDTTQFSDYIARNVALFEKTHSVSMSGVAIASFVRKRLATSLRSRKPYHVNVLIAHTDPATGKPFLYWIDHLSSMVSLPFAAHGYAAYFCMSTMDRYWRPDITLPEALNLMRKCVQELKTRFVGNLPEFVVKVTDKEGTRVVKL